jgi:hypothetical protein
MLLRITGSPVIKTLHTLCLLASLACTLAIARAQVTPIPPNVTPVPLSTGTVPATITNGFQIKPQLLTVNTAVDICSLAGGPPCHKDVYVCWFSAFTGSNATTITDADEQASPVTHDNAIAIAANTRYNLVAGNDQGATNPGSNCIGEWFPGGMTITAGTANYLTIYIRGKYWAGPPLF